MRKILIIIGRYFIGQFYFKFTKLKLDSHKTKQKMYSNLQESQQDLIYPIEMDEDELSLQTDDHVLQRNQKLNDAHQLQAAGFGISLVLFMIFFILFVVRKKKKKFFFKILKRLFFASLWVWLVVVVL